MSVMGHATATVDPESFETKQEAEFSNSVLPELRRLGVTVRGLRHVPGAGELHVALYLPSHDRGLRDEVLRLLQAFEESFAHTVSLSASLLHAEDLADD